MKNIHTLMMGLATAAAITFSSCGSDDVTDTPVPPVENPTHEITIDPDKIDNYSVEFTATDTWILTSDQVWCQLQQGDKTAVSLTGGAGTQEVSIVVDTDAATDKEQTATLTLASGGSQSVLARITLGTITYRGLIKLGNTTLRSDKSSGIRVFDYNRGPITIQANYDFHLEMPEWCLVNGQSAFEGKADKEYEVVFSFNSEAGADKRYSHKGDLVFAGEAARDVFSITYTGMNPKSIEIYNEKGVNDWTIDVANNLYSHYNAGSMQDETLTTPYIPFSVACRNDSVTFVYVSQDDVKEYHFYTQVNYAEIKDMGDHDGAKHYALSFKQTDDIPASGCVMAFATAAWDTIKADPVGCLFETSDGVTSWRYETNNNIVADWKLYKESNCPFAMIVDARTWGTYYEPVETHDYDSMFGCSGAWEITANLRSTRLLIQPDEAFGYETQWFGQGYVYAGFASNKMVNSANELTAMGFEPMNDQLHDKPALFLFLADEYLDAAAAGPLFIAFRKDDKMLLLVIKPE